MNIQTRDLGEHGRAVCQTCAWSHEPRYAGAHVGAFPDHRVLTVRTTHQLTFNVPDPKPENPDA